MSKKYFIDRKITMYVRTIIPEGTSKRKIIKELEKGSFWNDDCEQEFLYETEECLDIKNNDGEATVELLEQTLYGEILIWSNKENDINLFESLSKRFKPE